MPVYKVDKKLNVSVRAKIGNGHSGGIAASLEDTPAGDANEELFLSFEGANCVHKTLMVTAKLQKGDAPTPRPALLTLWVHQESPPEVFPTEEDADLFDADGACVVSVALTFI